MTGTWEKSSNSNNKNCINGNIWSSNNSFTNWKQFQVFKIAKFEFKVTVHPCLWERSAHLYDPLTIPLHCPPTQGLRWMEACLLIHSGLDSFPVQYASRVWRPSPQLLLHSVHWDTVKLYIQNISPCQDIFLRKILGFPAAIVTLTFLEWCQRLHLVLNLYFYSFTSLSYGTWSSIWYRIFFELLSWSFQLSKLDDNYIHLLSFSKEHIIKAVLVGNSRGCTHINVTPSSYYSKLMNSSYNQTVRFFFFFFFFFHYCIFPYLVKIFNK